MTATVQPPPRVAVLVTCLAEAFAPEVAESAAALVSRSHPAAQVTLVGHGCCGQPAWNAGYPAEARALATRLLPRLLPFDLVVVPSGSCATMLLRYYPHLFPAGTPMANAAHAVAARTRELSAFLANHLPAPAVGASHPAPATGEAPARPTQHGSPGPRPLVAAKNPPPAAGTADAVAFHPSCHSLRGAFVGNAGERCLEGAGCVLCAQAWSQECCGFGGLFAAKEPALSAAMADTKLDSLVASGAETVVSGEMGCLLHLEGRARRRGLRLRFRHLAPVLRERMPDA